MVRILLIMCRRMKTAGDKKAGFTLAETVISTFILALGLGMAGLTFNTGMRMVSTNRNQIAAMHLARNELERLRTYSYSDPVLAAGLYNISKPSYSGTYQVTPVGTDVKEIALSVNFMHHMTNGVSRATLTTRLSKPLH
jgi:Tfp pilus assembly protein PilV